jgi:hypothetical protein
VYLFRQANTAGATCQTDLLAEQQAPGVSGYGGQTIAAGSYSLQFQNGGPVTEGSYLLCGYLYYDGDGGDLAPRVAASTTVQVSAAPTPPPPPASTLTLTVGPNPTAPTAPSTNATGVTSITASGTAGQRSELFVVVRRDDGTPCPTAQQAHFQPGPGWSPVNMNPNIEPGSYSVTGNVGLDDAGAVLFCGYLDVHSGSSVVAASTRVLVRSTKPRCPSNVFVIDSAVPSSRPGVASVSVQAPAPGVVSYVSSRDSRSRPMSVTAGASTVRFNIFSEFNPEFRWGNSSYSVSFTMRYTPAVSSRGGAPAPDGCALSDETTGYPQAGPKQTFSVSFGPGAAALAAALQPTGAAAKIGALLRKGSYPARVRAAKAGTFRILWYFVPPGAHVSAAKPTLVASGVGIARRAGNVPVKVRLSATGKALLKRSQQIKLTVKGTATYRGSRKPNLTSQRNVTLKR